MEDFTKIANEVKDMKECPLKCLRSDSADEYCSREFKTYLNFKETVCQTTVPKTPQQSGVAERPNRTFIESVQSMIEQAELPNQF